MKIGSVPLTAHTHILPDGLRTLSNKLRGRQMKTDSNGTGRNSKQTDCMELKGTVIDRGMGISAQLNK